MHSDEKSIFHSIWRADNKTLSLIFVVHPTTDLCDHVYTQNSAFRYMKHIALHCMLEYYIIIYAYYVSVLSCAHFTYAVRAWPRERSRIDSGPRPPEHAYACATPSGGAQGGRKRAWYLSYVLRNARVSTCMPYHAMQYGFGERRSVQRASERTAFMRLLRICGAARETQIESKRESSMLQHRFVISVWSCIHSCESFL